MKMKLGITGTVIGISLSYTCLFAQDTTTFPVTFGNKYTIEIPKSMKMQSVDSGSNIILQYADASFKLFYVAILREPKTDVVKVLGHELDLESYYNNITEASTNKLKNGFFLTPVKLKINGIQVIKGVMQGKDKIPIREDEVDFYVTRAVFENDTYYYQILVWTELKLAWEQSSITDKIFSSLSRLN